MRHSRSLITLAVAALLPAGLALAQSTSTPGQTQPNQSSQGQTSPSQTSPSQSSQGQTTSPSQSSSQGRSTQDSRDTSTQSGQGTEQSRNADSSSRGTTSSSGTFRSMDADGDGRLSRTETTDDDALGRGFSQADRNGDGYIDNDEYQRSRSSPSDPGMSSEPRQ